MQEYEVWAGLGGGFGGANYKGTYEFMDYNEAMEEAREDAVEYYVLYEGTNGLRTVEEIAEENPELDEDEVLEIYNEEMEDRIEYYVVEV